MKREQHVFCHDTTIFFPNDDLNDNILVTYKTSITDTGVRLIRLW